MTTFAESHRITADLALEINGFDGARLLKLAHAVANDYLRKRGAVLGDRYEDFISALVEAGLRAARSYDPARSGPNYSFASYLWDKMELAAEPDFFRRKREGFGDRRYGNDGRIVLSAMDEEPDLDMDFESVISNRRLLNWQRAAQTLGWQFTDWVCFVLDDAAGQVERWKAEEEAAA